VARSDASKVKLRTVDKRTAGRRARETRDRILEALGKLLTTMPYRNIRVTDVVKEVGTSPATFYQYFADIESAALALAQEAVKDAGALKSLAEGATWTGKGGAAAVDKIVDGIATFWREHEAVLRVLDMASSEGDARFRRVRTQLINSLVAPIAAAAGDSKEAKANATALVGLLAYNSASRGAEGGTTAAELRAAVNRLVHWGVTGRKLAG
jgi:AcrR family transcriptional regulator